MKRLFRNIGFVICFIGIIYVSFYLLSSDSLKITTYEIEASQIQGLTIVHITDLHNHPMEYSNTNLLTQIDSSNPDLVFITGDVIDRNTNNMDNINLFFTHLEKYPVYFVYGNHEQNAYKTEELNKIMHEHSVHILKDQEETIYVKGQKINLLGLLDPSFYEKEHFLFENKGNSGDTLEKLTKDLDGYTILLAHRPELLSLYATFPIDMVFAGHAHGGQIRLPYSGALYIVNQGVFPKYDRGKFKKGDTQMILSSGLGTSVFDVRICCDSELVIVKYK